MKDWFKGIYQWLLPLFCLLCQQKTSGTLLCQACFNELPWQATACRRCGLAFAYTAECSNPLTENSRVCGQCLKKPPPYDTTICLFDYQPPISQLTLALKFADKLLYGRLLGELMANKIADYYALKTKPEYIIPMPLHKLRLQERGYNQAIELTRPIAKRLAIPMDIMHCQRILPTQPQALVSAKQRKRNIKNAFIVNPLFQANYVAIVDDVLTTGSTVTELSRVLKKAGIKRIDVWCCARTLLHQIRTN